jgi:hypothetical protein
MEDGENHTNESFNEDFCDTLEYHLCTTFEHSDREDVKGFWCDGVSSRLLVESQLSKKSVNDTRRIETDAWIGTDGQQPYTMIIRFGKYSLRRYAKGRSIVDCIPSYDSMDWIDIDIEKRTIEIRLK